MLRRGLLSLIRGLVDLVLPPLCCLCGRVGEEGICASCKRGFERIGGPFCSICGRPFPSPHTLDHPCPDCIESPPPFRRARSAALYRGDLVRAIHAFKFQGRTHLAGPLADLLKSSPVDFQDYHLILPVPLHRRRLRERGFNQSLLLATRLGRLCSIDVAPRLLRRMRDTPPQTGLRRGERVKNVRGAFGVSDPGPVKGKRVLLIDDIYTTGATVKECARVLKKAGAEFVDVLTLARVAAEPGVAIDKVL